MWKFKLGLWLASAIGVPLAGSVGGRTAEIITMVCVGVFFGMIPFLLMPLFRSRAVHADSSEDDVSSTEDVAFDEASSDNSSS